MSIVRSQRRNFPHHWEVVPFDEAFEDLTGGNAKVQMRAYLRNGALPVIDQSQATIAGYVNDRTLACRAPLPCILFGAHTRIFKYVSTPFALGADGVKVLSPRPYLDARFAYHFLKTVRLPNDLGYSRHFKHLREANIPLPPMDEQRRIAAILDNSDAIRRKRQEAIALTEELLRSAFLEIFGDPVTNPKGWPIKDLNTFINEDRPITYGILKPGPNVPEGVPYVRVVDIRSGIVNTAGLRHTSREIDQEYRRSRLRPGDLLMSIRGHVGRLAVVPSELNGANITQDTARIAPVGLDPAYLVSLLETEAIQFWMLKHIRGVAVRGINIGDVRRIPIPVPPPKLQARFAELTEVTTRARSTARCALREAEDLFSALLSHFFSRNDGLSTPAATAFSSA